MLYTIKNPSCGVLMKCTFACTNPRNYLDLPCLPHGLPPARSVMFVQGPDIAIHHPDSVLGEMNSWCIEHHGESGLTERCRESIVSMEEAEAQVSSDFPQSS